jgi:hypothetical protein
MRRSFSAIALGTVSVGLASVFMLPATAHAVTTARPLAEVCNPPADNGHRMVPEGIISAFIGCTYPDTSAGLAACEAMGTYDVEHGGVAGYSCALSDPDAGVYNLWIHTGDD